MSDDRLCSFCGTSIHPNDRVYDISTDAKAAHRDHPETYRFCQFCAESSTADAWLWNPDSFDRDTLYAAKDRNRFANILRDDIRRLTGGQP